MPHAIRIHQNGGPEVMRFEEVDIPPPGGGEVRLRHSAIGINFSDVNVRRGGFYFGRPQQFPARARQRGGRRDRGARGGVGGFAVGERVAYAGMRGEFFDDTGAYAEARNVPAERLLKVPDGVSDRQAAAMLVKGFTAWLIVNRLYRPKARRHDPDPRHRGRRRLRARPMVAASRRHGHRHGRLGTKGRVRAPARLRTTRCSIARPISSQP
jgi:NADPH2:quinone reductase